MSCVLLWTHHVLSRKCCSYIIFTYFVVFIKFVCFCHSDMLQMICCASNEGIEDKEINSHNVVNLQKKKTCVIQLVSTFFSACLFNFTKL